MIAGSFLPLPHPQQQLPPSIYPSTSLPAEGAPESGEESLTRRQLLERRLARAEQLSQLYRAELWALLEELRLRHAQFVAQPGLSVWKEGGGGSKRAQQEPAGPAASPQGEGQEGAGAQQQQPSKRQKQAGGGRAAAKAAAAAGGDEDQQQQEEAASPGPLSKDEAEPSGDPGSLLRALWERRQRGEQPPSEDGQPGGEKEDKGKAQQGRRGRQGKAASRKEPPGRRCTRLQEQQEAAQAAAGKAAEAGANSVPQGAGAEAGNQAAAREKQQAAQQPPPPPPPLLPRFEEVEELLLGSAAAALPPPDEAALLAARQRFVQRLALLGRLEQSSLAGTCRELDSLGGLALLCGRRRRFVLRRAAVTLGRCTDSAGMVREGAEGQQVAGLGVGFACQRAPDGTAMVGARLAHYCAGPALPLCSACRPSLLHESPTLPDGQSPCAVAAAG